MSHKVSPNMTSFPRLNLILIQIFSSFINLEVVCLFFIKLLLFVCKLIVKGDRG